MLTLESFPFVYFIFLHQKLKAATIDHIPDALRISKRRDREPLPPASATGSGPVPQAMPSPSPTHLVGNTMTTNPTMMNSQGYTHPGFAVHGFPSFSAPAFPITYPMPVPNYPMPAPMYASPYGYPFTHHGATQAMQPNGFPAPAYLMQNYPAMPNYPAPMYPPPSGYPIAMPPPQGANLDYGRKRQRSVSDHDQIQANLDLLEETGVLNTDPSLGPVAEWITDRDTPNLDS